LSELRTAVSPSTTITTVHGFEKVVFVFTIRARALAASCGEQKARNRDASL
jgi:hypothetical protein